MLDALVTLIWSELPPVTGAHRKGEPGVYKYMGTMLVREYFNHEQ